MALVTDELWMATIMRALEIAKEHASDDEKPRMEQLHFVGIADDFNGEKDTYGIIKVLKG